MNSIIFFTSVLTLSCAVAYGPPEPDVTPPPSPASVPAASAGSDLTPPSSLAAAPAGHMATSVPAVPGTAEACRACDGDWGVHGIAETESCNCGTNDGGKRCTDGIDCQGMCVADAENPEYEAVEAGPPARGFLVGRCSEVVTVFGCNALVELGARASAPVSSDELPPVLCVD